MRQEWSPEDVVACWTLVDGDWLLVANKSGPTRLGFALILKFFEQEALSVAEFGKYAFAGRTAEYHRKQIREALGFRPSTRADEERLISWLATEVCPVELVEDRLAEALLQLCVLVALRDAIRRREIYVEGGLRWRNPENDLPGDFEATRTAHYAAICQPMDPQAFIADLKQRMTVSLDRLSAVLADGSAGGVKVITRKGEPWITVPKLEPLEEPASLQALKDEVVRRWGVLDLLDVLKNADFLSGFTDEFVSVAAYERIDRAVLQGRLLLALFALVILSCPKGVLDVEQAQMRPRVLPGGSGYLPSSITQIPWRSDARTTCGDAVLAA
ncbi:hypothetical protein [Streptomyces sp. NPDC053431]|uniref:hypothetical protein n=1 Tax=Streptomyces sp. NPDC053431 TaxID=3365703 RepID=UPI0037CD32AB